MVNIYIESQSHRAYGFWRGDSLIIFLFFFSGILVSMATNKTEQQA